MENGNRTEGMMSDTTTLRYGYNPGIAFASTRAFAERRALETAGAAAGADPTSHSLQRLIRRLASHLTGSAG